MPRLNKIISDSRRLEEEIDKTKNDVIKFTKEMENVDHAASGNSIISYRNDPDWEGNKNNENGGSSPTSTSKGNGEMVSIIKENEVTESLPELRLMLQVFEENS